MKTFHWTTVAVVVALLAIGWTMASDLETIKPIRGSLFALHKSLGLSLLFLTLLRISWRASHRVPPVPPVLRPWEIKVFQTVHYLLYGLLILQPLAGWAIASIAPKKSLFFGLFPIPDLPLMPAFPHPEILQDVLEDVHATLAVSLAVLIGLHVAAALRHHFQIRDNVLVRMSPAFTAPFLRKLRKEP